MEELSAGGLIGTPALKGYMHGFFMEMKLYSKLRAVSKPFEYEEHRKKKIKVITLLCFFKPVLIDALNYLLSLSLLGIISSPNNTYVIIRTRLKRRGKVESMRRRGCPR